MNVKPGDLFAFAGRGLVSSAIKVFTCSRYSHVAGVANVERRHFEPFWPSKFDRDRLNRTWVDGLCLIESTTLTDSPCLLTGLQVGGVQVQSIERRIESYDGSVWHLPLSEEWMLDPHESDLLTYYLLAKVGRPYPKYEWGFAGGNIVKHWLFHPENFNYVFCSQLWCGALERVNRHEQVNASKVNPGQLIRRLVDVGTYLPPVKIK